MWQTKDPTQLPAALRKNHGYPYLCNSLFPMWLEGLEVSHRLLDAHEQQHGNDTYYQDNFGKDYIGALANPQFGADEIVFNAVTDPSMAHLHRKDHPSWQALKEACEGLKTAPRGAIALLGDADRWHIRIHAGDGYISDCKTMRSSGPKPSIGEIQNCVLSYEAYLSRCQARDERAVLKNFARLRELDLQPGQTVRDVELQHNGKRSKISFTIKSISDTGYLSLVDGVLRGSRSRFTATVPARDVTASQAKPLVPTKVAAPGDLATALLF